MSDLNLTKLVEQFEQLSDVMLAISATFRIAGDAGRDSAVDEKPAKPSKATKARSKVEAGAKESGEELTIDDVRAKLKDLIGAKGKDKMVEVLGVVGADKLSDVDESQYQELFDLTQKAIDAEEEEEATASKKPASKKAKAKKGPTLEEVTTAAKALIEMDKPAYMKLTKKLGKPSDMDESDYAAAITAYEEAMPEADADADEEDML